MLIWPAVGRGHPRVSIYFIGTRVNPLANLIEFRKMPGGQKSSKPRKSLLRGEPVPLDPDAHR